MTLFLTILAVAAFALSVVALGFALAAVRQSGGVASDLRRHRLAHTRADGQADPGAGDGGERRRRNHGPPRATGERRQRERPQEPPEQLTTDDAPTEEQEAASGALGPRTAAIRAQLPRPGEHGRGRP